MKKRLLAILLTVCMVLSVAPAALAAEAALTISTADDLYAYDNSSGSQDGEIGENADAWVAQVGETKCATLAAAVAAAEDGDPVTLLADVTLTEALTINKGVTLDLGGKTVSASESISVTSGDVTIKNGTIDSATHAIRLGVNGDTDDSATSVVLNIESDVTVKADGCAVITFAGTLNTEGALETSSEGVAAIQGNGNAANAGTVINITGGSITGTAPDSMALYIPQDGELNISGGTITAGSGLFIKNGKVNVTGGTITATYKAEDNETQGNGASTTGMAFVVEASDAYGVPEVSITGGTFISEKSAAVGSFADQSNALVTGFISGGTYSGAVSLDEDLIVEGATAAENGDGTWGIVPETTDSTVATVGNVAFDSLPAAVAAAQDGDTVTLLKDIELTAELEDTRDISYTLEGNGHTISGVGLRFINADCALKDIVFEACTGGGGTNDGILEFVNSRSSVTDCVFRNNTCSRCIDVDSSVEKGTGTSEVVISGCSFTDNTCSKIGVVSVLDGVSTVIEDCSFTGNSAGSNMIYLGDAASVTGCYFSGNTINGDNANKAAIVAGPYSAGDNDVTLTGNAFLDSSYPGVWMEDWAEQFGANNAYDISGNYWADGSEPVVGVDYGVTNVPGITNLSYMTACSIGADGSLTLSGEEAGADAVAEVGGEYYITLEAAIDAADAGDTVKLLQPVAMHSGSYAFDSVVTIDKALTLDLNGQTISHTGDKYSCAITVETPNASDVVIIKNGTVSSESGTGTNFAAVMVETGAVTLEGVTVTNARTDAHGSNAVRTGSAGSSVTLTGCTVTGYLSGTGSIKIQSGTYKSIIEGQNSLGTGIEVFDGTFAYELTMEDCAVGYKPRDNGDGTWTVEANPFVSSLTINDLDELKVFRDMVNAGNDFSGKTITLAADIDLNNEAWTPIGTSANKFKGTFNGGNNTISNLYVTQANNAGLFGYIEYATIKDLTVDNVEIPAAGTAVGAVVGRSINGVKLENVKVTGTVEITGLNYVGGIIGYGWSNYEYTNCSVDVDDGSYVKGAEPKTIDDTHYTSYVGGLVGYGGPNGKITGCSVNNLDLRTYYDDTYTAYGIGGLNGMAQTGVVIDGCSVTNVTIDAAEPTATGTVVGSNNGTVADPVWLNNTTISNVTVTVKGDAATAGMVGAHGLNGGQMVEGCAFIGTGMQRDSNGELIAGTFDGDVTAYVAADYQRIEIADETWSVVPDSVIVTFNSNGGSDVEDLSVIYGGTATRPADPTRSGYSFLGWYSDSSLTTEFNFDAAITADITVYAKWSKNSSGGGMVYPTVPSYSIKVEDADNGDLKVSHSYADRGQTVTITVDPDKGYTLETLTVTNKNGKEIKLTKVSDAKYTFKMPASRVTVEATFMEDNTVLNYFVDVFASDYYDDAVLWAVENGITNGTSATTFSPDAVCTRAQVVTFLWRAAGCPEAETTVMPFTDVAEGSYYYEAVLWAVENGITNGTSATAFSPDADCTRGQIVTFLWRSQGSEDASAYNPFVDVANDAYYTEAVLWAVENDITNGTGADTFSPDADCTRAQIVTFLWRCLNK